MLEPWQTHSVQDNSAASPRDISCFHSCQEPIEIEFFFVLSFVPEVSELVKNPLFALFANVSFGVHCVCLINGVWILCLLLERQSATVSITADVKQVQYLVRLHGTQPGILLIDHCACHVDLETLEAVGNIVSNELRGANETS